MAPRVSWLITGEIVGVLGTTKLLHGCPFTSVLKWKQRGLSQTLGSTGRTDPGSEHPGSHTEPGVWRSPVFRLLVLGDDLVGERGYCSVKRSSTKGLFHSAHVQRQCHLRPCLSS